MIVAQYLREPPAWFSARILVGPGEILTPKFAQENRVTHVINCAQDIFCPMWWKVSNPKRYVFLDAIDSEQHNILDWYPKFEETLQGFLRESLNGVVYVHCHAGMNRSASLALAYVCSKYSLPLPSVVSAVRRQRPCILQNPVFMTQVKQFIQDGCVSSSQNTGLNFVRNHSGNVGLFASDDSSGAKRV
jgi:predicted protein tyrosine phosphatase